MALLAPPRTAIEEMVKRIGTSPGRASLDQYAECTRQIRDATILTDGDPATPEDFSFRFLMRSVQVIVVSLKSHTGSSEISEKN
jgi:hypothetical protein